MKSLKIVVPGKPVPKGRPRFGRGRTFTPKTTRDYESRIAEAAAAAMAAAGVQRVAGRVSVIVDASVAIPSSYRGRKRSDAILGYSFPSGDVDNFAKAALDGMNGIVWDDDKQVVQMGAAKRWAEDGGQLSIEVYFLD